MYVFGYEKMFWRIWFLAKSSEGAFPTISNIKVYLVYIFIFGKQIHYCRCYSLAAKLFGCVCGLCIIDQWTFISKWPHHFTSNCELWANESTNALHIKMIHAFCLFISVSNVCMRMHVIMLWSRREFRKCCNWLQRE